MNPLASPQLDIWAPEAPKLGPEKAKIPRFWPILACLAQKDLEKFSGSGAKKIKKFFLLQITFKGPPEGLAPSKTPNSRSGPPGPPRLGPFCGQNGPNRGQKRVFSKKYFLIHITPGRSPEGLVPSKTQN